MARRPDAARHYLHTLSTNRKKAPSDRRHRGLVPRVGSTTSHSVWEDAREWDGEQERSLEQPHCAAQWNAALPVRFDPKTLQILK